MAKRFILPVVISLLAAPGARGQSALEFTPYKMRIYVAYARQPELDAGFQQDFARRLQERIWSRIGGAWRALDDAEDQTAVNPVEVLPAPPALNFALRKDIEDVALEHLPVEAFKFDKIILLRVRPDDGGLEVSARDFDVRTQRFNDPVQHTAAQREMLTSAAFSAVYDAFTPLAMIDQVLDERSIADELKKLANKQGKEPRRFVVRVKLLVRGSAIKLRDPALTLSPPQAVYRPIVRYNNRDLTPKAIRDLPWTFIVPQTADDDVPQTRGLDHVVHSGLRSALTNRRRGRIEQLALAVKRSQWPTTLTVVSRTDPERRLSEYEVFSYHPPSPTTTLLGYTDHNGEIEVRPTEAPLSILVIKNGGEFLVKLPIVPGWQERLTAEVRDDDSRLAVEGFITALQEEMVEVYVTRAILLARIKKRMEEGKYAEAQGMLAEIDQLKPLRKFLEELKARQDDASSKSSDLLTQRRIDQLFADTRTVMEKFLDDKPVREVRQELKAATGN